MAIQMVNDRQDIKCIAKCYDILFPNKQMQMYSDISCFQQLCINLQRMRLNKKYEYADYPIDILPYDDFTNMFDHSIRVVRLTFEVDIKRDNSNYINYLKNLLENNEKFMSASIFSDYIGMLYNNRNYTQVYDIFRKYKEYIIHKIQIAQNVIVKLNFILSIIVSCYNVNKNISMKCFNEIIENIKPEDYIDTGIIKKTYTQINIIIDRIKRRNSIIKKLGFDIVDRSKVGETCLICLDEIDDANTETVKCIFCKRELGHINCVCKWIGTNQTCPHCRSGIMQRLSMID
jgi:hypothetical protein